MHIAGISLGGGLATISYLDIVQFTEFDLVKITTFGAPRVGNLYWATFYDVIAHNKTRRYVVEGDAIPNMPQCLTALCSYRQVGIKIVCSE